MGVLRLSLALVVVLAHCGPLWGFAPLNGLLAVQTFFMISGFYMAMILTEKYKGPGSYKLFLTNRFLRIYPTYWAVLLFALAVNTLMFFVVGVGPLEAPHKTGLGGLVLLTFSNLFIFGQDLVMYVGTLPRGPLFFTTNYHVTMPQVWTYLLIPPGWSLSLELCFYLIAPFIARRSLKTILACMAVSLGLRAWIFFHLHLTNDPWTGRFFPTEIVFFLAGAVCYRVWLGLKIYPRLERFSPVIAVAFFGWMLVYQFLPDRAIGELPLKQAVYYPLAWLAIPFVFALTNRSRIDRCIGELSYPVYLIHYPMMRLLIMVLHHVKFDHLLPPIEIVSTLAASALVARLVSLPLEKIRRSRISDLHQKHEPQQISQSEISELSDSISILNFKSHPSNRFLKV